MTTRVYVPVAVSALRRLSAEGRLGSAPVPAYAVTPDLRQAHPGADEEELEYRALVEAATGRPAVVVAADVERDVVQEVVAGDNALGVVRLTEPVAMRQVASFHVPGALGATGDPELSWYDATELTVVLDALPGPG